MYGQNTYNYLNGTVNIRTFVKYKFKIMKTLEARFDTRLPKQQKELFERAAMLGGYRTLTEFVIYSVQDKAKQIIDEHSRILSSEKDKEVFFNAILGESEPNRALTTAAKKYNDALSNK